MIIVLLTMSCIVFAQEEDMVPPPSGHNSMIRPSGNCKLVPGGYHYGAWETMHFKCLKHHRTWLTGYYRCTRTSFHGDKCKHWKWVPEHWAMPMSE